MVRNYGSHTVESTGRPGTCVVRANAEKPVGTLVDDGRRIYAYDTRGCGVGECRTVREAVEVLVSRQAADPCVGDDYMPTAGCVWPECGAHDVNKPCPAFGTSRQR
jgi:hypothetical protein